MSDAKAALAFAARRQGQDAMPLASWAHVLSLELKWLAPAEARTYVAACWKAGLLEGEEGSLQPTFDVAATEVPRRFRLQSGATPPDPVADPFLQWVDRLAGDRGRDAVLAEVAALQESHGGLLDAQAAVLLLAARAGHDVKDAARQALRAIG